MGDTKKNCAITLGNNLRKAIKESNIYKMNKDLAIEVGISPVSLSNYLTGESLPPLDVLLKLADRLNVSIDDLLGRNNNFAPIPESPTLPTVIKNLMAMDDQDIIDLRMNPEKGGQYTLSFRNEKINKFFHDYYLFMQEMRHKEGGEDFYKEWLEKQFDELSKETL